MKKDMTELLASYLDALYPIIYINSYDLKAVDRMIADVADNRRILEFYDGFGCIDFIDKSLINVCTLSSFLRQMMEEGYDGESLVVLKNIYNQLENAEIVSLLKYIAKRNLYDEDYHVAIFIVSSKRRIPEELKEFATFFAPPLPDADEVRDMIAGFMRDMDMAISEEIVDEFVIPLTGLNEFQIEKILHLAYQNGGNLDMEDKYLIRRQKEQLIQKNDILEVISANDSTDDIGGLENLKEWLYRKEYIFKRLNEAQRVGVDIPKGMLITGMPGCGKSLAVKMAGVILDVSLVRLKEERLSGECISGFEVNLQKTLDLLEMISPCILWIDEIENIFVKDHFLENKNDLMSWYSQLLIRIQEKKLAVFLAATANDIFKASSKLLERDFFDEWFYVDFPNSEERRRIIEIHLRKRKKWNPYLNTDDLSELTEGYSGADLEAIVRVAIEHCFIQGRNELSAEDLVYAQSCIKPVSEALREKVAKIRETAQNENWKPADKVNNRLAIKPWNKRRNTICENGFVRSDAVTLYEILGKDWWKKPGAKFIDQIEQENIGIGSGAGGYGIELI